ncbi:PLP-dependent aspartate aminotransferase family protein [Myxococcota bacterium]|nr:PLP-dependent aspartate aminotransferase family protein [Myxococcota bacterium]
MRFDTKVVRATVEPDPTTGAIVPPIYQTATYVLPEIGKNRGYDYTRSSNPTRAQLESMLAALEGTKYAVTYASGMSAVDAVMKMFRPGDHIISSDDVYGGVSRLFNRILSHYGMEFTYVDSSNPNNVAEAIRPNTKLIWLETPTNPLLKVTDLEAIAKIAKEHKIICGVDSTFATPALLRPAEFGIDIVMHSTTKYISGHNQIIGGAVLTSDEEIHKQLRFVQKAIGAVPSPFDCWLIIGGLRTLALRMERHSQNAMKVATFLEQHPKVSRVSYPGLPSHPGHQVAKRQMSAFSGMISFELKGGIPAGVALLNNVKLCALAESLGSVETMITHPATMTHAEVPKDERLARGLTDGLCRLSVGIEDVQDIIEDLENALEKI